MLELCLTTARNRWGRYPELSWDQMERIAHKAAIAGTKAKALGASQREIVDALCRSFEAQFQSKAHIGRGNERERVMYFVEHWPQ